MDSGPIVVDISSDDEPDDFSVSKPVDISYDLIDQWLNDEEGKDDVNNFVDLDSVKNSASLRSKTGAVCDDSDDDIMVLDGDPDKPVAGDDDKGDGKYRSDDLCIVGQKGQVACRDFPHSRHLCANFPFNSTSHEKHCNLCHCFVCDSPAPCIYWGTGVSLSDHCHATDKDERWKLQRKSIKNINTSTLPPQKLPGLKHPLTQPIQNPEPIFHRIPARTPSQTFKTSLRPCSATVTSAAVAPGTYQSSQRHHQNPANIRYPVHRLNQHQTPSEPPQRAQPVHRVNRGGVALASMSHAQFKRAGNTGSGLISASMTRIHHTVSDPNQVRRLLLSQRPGNLPAASLGSQQQPQHTAFSRNQMHRAVSLRPQHLPAASLGGSQQQPVALPRSLSMPVTSQRSLCAPVTTQASQSTTIASADDDSMRKWQDILAGVAAELGVADSISKTATGAQPCTASSQPPDFDTPMRCQMNSGQGIGLHTDLGPPTISSNSIDFDPGWLDSSVGQNFSEQGVLPGDLQAATVKPSDPLISQYEAVSGDVHVESFLAAMDETAPVPGEEIGLPEVDPASFLYDFDSSWSSIANVQSL